MAVVGVVVVVVVALIGDGLSIGRGAGRGRSALARSPASLDVTPALGWSLGGETGTLFLPFGFVVFIGSASSTARVSLLAGLVRRLGAKRSTTSWLVDVGRGKGNPFVQLHQTS